MSRSPERRRNRQRSSQRRSYLIVGLVFALIFGGCAVTTVLVGRRVLDAVFQREPVTENAAIFTWAADSAELTIAVSPVMAPTLAERVDAFNSQGQRTRDSQTMRVVLTELAPEKMVAESLNQPPFQAVAPDSSLWLNQIDQRWAADHPAESGGIAPRRVGDPTRFAISPIVLAAWEDTAQNLGWPDNPVGWAEIQQKATSDPNFKWNHPNTQHAAGLLATLAEFYAGAGLTRGLTAEIASQQSVLDYVRDAEATVRFYGEGEDVIVQRLEQEGRSFLDAFVAQEQTVIAWNQRHNANERLIALYPKEGTLWTDHPLALLELGAPGETAVTDNQRRTFRAFADFLLNSESQQAFLAAGYRPADVGIDLSGPGSPFAGTDPSTGSGQRAVDASQPKTTLQIPSAAVVEVVQNVWWYTKRPTNVYLVVDTSGSMAGEKIDRTRVALQSFVAQIQGDRDRVGLVEFGSGVKRFEPLQSLNAGGRARLVEIIAGMEADGYTALLDAVWQAQEDLQTVADADAINALVVMTDGQENDSYRDMNDLRGAFQNAHTPVVVFTIAFGSDADDGLLQELARIGGGQFRRADETDIEELYRILSTYF
ncbi:MAG: VWA domain-containing protein [Chloroflexi bacterium]|nr:VWA domain-containing protein [Chloroflexota bacterium]